MTIFRLAIFLFCIITVFHSSCKKFVQVDPPKSNLISETVFREDATAIAAISSLYGLMNTNGFSSGTITSITYLSGLSSDELQNFNTGADRIQFSNNALLSTNSANGTIWSSAYATIYRANAIIEGLFKSNSLTSSLKKQLEGEAKFARAFSFFYLTNLYGEVPLSLTTDYRVNRVMPKTAKEVIYNQIIADLKSARDSLSDNYSFSMGERVRPNKWVATAMLARVYLYIEDWISAEAEATKMIDNKEMYELQPLNNVFLKNSKEAIWQLNNNALNANESATFIFSTRPSNAALLASFFNAFEANDQRKAVWITVKTSGITTYYQPAKYKANRIPPTTNPATLPVEYSMVLRLAEQYLIRAEARIQRNNIDEGISDLNVLRARASLPPPNHLTPIALNLSRTDALLAVERERFWELFTEWGHRWLDLKRTQRADVVLKAFKGNNWQSNDQLYPIPKEQITNNPSMTNSQNPGYN